MPSDQIRRDKEAPRRTIPSTSAAVVQPVLGLSSLAVSFDLRLEVKGLTPSDAADPVVRVAEAGGWPGKARGAALQLLETDGDEDLFTHTVANGEEFHWQSPPVVAERLATTFEVLAVQ